MNKAYLLLGRSGDVCNFLPVIKYEAEKKGYIPKLIIAKEYASLIDGVSYVEPIIWEKNFWEYYPAREWAEKTLKDCEIINCSVTGRNYTFKITSASFSRESWHFANCPVPWGQLPLIFDKRSKEREQNILAHFNVNHKPIVLLSLSGISAPFGDRHPLHNFIRDELKEFEVIDISEYRAERFYDILSLYEKAQCLITVDTGTLHLAHAVPTLPVITLLPQRANKWLIAEWRPQHIVRLYYSEARNNFHFIAKAVREGFNLYQRKIHCITSWDSSNPDFVRRVKFARDTWTAENNYTKRWNFIDYPEELIEKRNATSVNDKIKMPFVKDMIEYAAKDIDDEDIIMICNADICFVPGITGWILNAIQNYGSAYLHRHDFTKLTKPLIFEADVKKGIWYCGVDAFAFSKKWWQKNKGLFYDVIFGRMMWDLLMHNIILQSKGVGILDAIYHEKHNSYWENRNNRLCGGNEHNKNLVNKWINRYSGNANSWKLEEKDSRV